jgi:bacteriocin-like protein
MRELSEKELDHVSGGALTSENPVASPRVLRRQPLTRVVMPLRAKIKTYLRD